MAATRDRIHLRAGHDARAEWPASLDACAARLRAGAGGLSVVEEAPVKREQVRLAWRDDTGRIERVLDVSRKGCPVCRSWWRIRVDTHGLVEGDGFVPVVCLRCPPRVYYALPIRDATELRDLRELRAAHAFPEPPAQRSWWARARAVVRAALTEWRSP
jgi:hypothetical protein